MSKSNQQKAGVHTRPLKIGDRVLVHQIPGISLTDDGIKAHAHDCSKLEQHWESRIIKRSRSHHNCWEIVTPNHGLWPYPNESLTLHEGEDWARESALAPGVSVISSIENRDTRWRNSFFAPVDDPIWDALEGRVAFAGIEPGMWCINFRLGRNGITVPYLVHERNIRIKKGRTP